MKKEKSCGGVIIDSNNKILLIKHNQGHWSFPKGHVINKETEIETAIREIKEETNLDVEIIEDVSEQIEYIIKEDTLKTVVFFLCLTNEEKVTLQKSEVCDYIWLDYESALNKLTHNDSKEVLKRIYSKIIK